MQLNSLSSIALVMLTYGLTYVMCYKGVVKSIGVSNYTRAHLEELLQYCHVRPSVLQV